ncbi:MULTISPECIES: hypothetical protein [Streptosporangium]|uniref:Uncharacterized protein n=1 Tax=Streptosporangium brasiliense TaxID=47480 RepID=A0ABT9R6X5_9ACTN|nr:hypothetical protein [Streptosporangium brasiliense]MDP9864544.1 hypothetical protein [Streptosporangium brasiliense]
MNRQAPLSLVLETMADNPDCLTLSITALALLMLIRKIRRVLRHLVVRLRSLLATADFTFRWKNITVACDHR